MEKEFIPDEQSLSLKELGFDEPCLIKDAEQGEECAIYYVHDNGKPTFSQAFRWFRKKHELSPEITWFTLTTLKYSARIKSKLNTEYIEMFDTPEEADLACLIRLIEIVKTKHHECNH
jgi:hypothetical protein